MGMYLFLSHVAYLFGIDFENLEDLYLNPLQTDCSPDRSPRDQTVSPVAGVLGPVSDERCFLLTYQFSQWSKPFSR